LHNFVVEDGIVKSKTKLNGVAGGEISGNLFSLFVVLEGTISSLVQFVSASALCHVSVVVTDHFQEESLSFSFVLTLHCVILDHVNNVLAILVEFLLNLFLVITESTTELSVLGVLLNS